MSSGKQTEDIMNHCLVHFMYHVVTHVIACSFLVPLQWTHGWFPFSSSVKQQSGASVWPHCQTLIHVIVSVPMQRLANTKAHTSRFISANLPCNKFKNRLVNIMPYESTRVCLQPIRGVEGSDYINASFIDGYR